MQIRFFASCTIYKISPHNNRGFIKKKKRKSYKDVAKPPGN